MSQKKKNNIIIGSLCTLVLLMVVGYAAFSSVLNIKGTSSISSNWNVLITKVASKNIVGGASNAVEPTWEALTATFKTNLVSPGDAIEYDITVSNQGTLNATLDKITLTDSNNPAIKFTSSGLEEGSELNAGESKILTVKVEYDNNVTSQPAKTDGTFKVTLDYSQKEGSGVVPTNQTVYRWGTETVNNGDSVDSLVGTTTDYTTLNKSHFIKHTIKDNVVEDTELCMIKDNELLCIAPIASADFNANKSNLQSHFNENDCTDNGQYWTFSCMVNNIGFRIDINNGFYVEEGNSSCTASSSYSNCFISS